VFTGQSLVVVASAFEQGRDRGLRHEFADEMQIGPDCGHWPMAAASAVSQVK